MLVSTDARVRSRSGSLRASLRVSSKYIPFTSSGPSKRERHSSLPVPVAVDSDRLSFSEEDLVDLAPEELVAANALPVRPQSYVPPTSPLEPSSPPLFVRSRQSLSRFASFNRRSRPTTLRFSSSERPLSAADKILEPIVDETGQVYSFPRPPSVGPSALRRASTESHPTPAQTVSFDEPSSILYDDDPFRNIDAFPQSSQPKLIPASPLRVVEEVVDPNSIEPSPPATRISSQSTISPSLAISTSGLGPLRKTIQRLRTLTRARAPTLAGQRDAPGIRQIFPADGEGASASSAAGHAQQFLPELSFDSTPLADLIFEQHVPANAVKYQDGIFQQQDPLPVPPPAAAIRPEAAREQSLQLVKWQRVDPKDLTPSPYSIAATDLSPAETPLIVPSPSWLSRNTFDLEFRRNPQIYHLQGLTPAPPSPSPLPIPNRSLLPASSSTSSAELSGSLE
ncbi:hypothetical protein BDW22DRAFT_78512 [Trametopsis cervina]|nr:hypothetical protein BDW22DRAFT_78512 [Trametopsis cervina]